MTGTTAAAQEATGILEVHPSGYGFLRHLTNNGATNGEDIYVAAEMIRKYSLRPGLRVTGPVAPARPAAAAPVNNRRGPQNGQRRGPGRPQPVAAQGQDRKPGLRLASISEIEGVDPTQFHPPHAFETLTPIDPTRWLKLETTRDRLTTRVLDLFTPIGKGQRGLIVAPPRTGKTILLQHVAEGISTNYPEVELIVLLIDERPEEVTEMRRTIRGQVVASSNDRDTVNHTRLAELTIERCKRMAERGRDVVVLLDSITRLARAYNKHSNTGRTMSGGLDVRALDIPKKLFGSARAFDEGGSLTILGTALVETNSRMDDVIFEEFKGTGNMELVLDRKLSDRRIYPAIDLWASGTRKEERLLPEDWLQKTVLLRRSMSNMNPVDAMDRLLAHMKKFDTNEEFLNSLDRFSR